MLIGYFTAGAVELAGALVFAAGIWTVWPAQWWAGAAAGHISARRRKVGHISARRRKEPHA
jgi:hypothetical protein